MKYKLILFVLTLLIGPSISTAIEWDQIATEITIGEQEAPIRDDKVVIRLNISPDGKIQLIHLSLEPPYYEVHKRLLVAELTRTSPHPDLEKPLAEQTFSLKGLFDPQGHMGPPLYRLQRGIPFTLSPMNDFNPQTGGHFTLRYSTFHYFNQQIRNHEIILSLVKDGNGTWYLADKQGELLHKIYVKMNFAGKIGQILGFSEAYGDSNRPYRRLDYALEENSYPPIDRNSLNVTQQANQIKDTESTFSTHVSIGEHSPLRRSNRYFNITLNKTENGNVDSIRIRFIDNGHLTADNTFSLEQLFSPEGLPTSPLYYGQKAIPISFQGLNQFDPQKGGRFTIQYSTFHLFNQQRNHKVTLSLIKRDQNWYLADEQGIPLKEIRMKIDFFGKGRQVIGIPATADGRPYWRLDQPAIQCAF